MSDPLAIRADVVKKRLAVIWFTGAGLLFLLVLALSFANVYGSETEQAWAWLLASIMPTLSLIVGVLVTDAQQPGQDDKIIDGFIPRLAIIFSIVYLMTVASTILVQPLSGRTPLTLMNQSHLWLAPFQGLVTSLMGVLFVKQGRAPEPAAPASEAKEG
jgi:hypothetical protein